VPWTPSVGVLGQVVEACVEFSSLLRSEVRNGPLGHEAIPQLLNQVQTFGWGKEERLLSERSTHDTNSTPRAPNDIEFSGEEEGAQRLTMSPLQ
jgi:hypothetical protein